MTQLRPLPYLGDGDGDAVNDGDEDKDSHGDNDNDRTADYGSGKDKQPYLDRDDNNNLAALGPPVGAAERAAIAAVVRRYYAAAAAGDGRKACTLLIPGQAKEVPADAGLLAYWLRGSKTCSGALTRLFRHFRASVRAPVAVTAAYVDGDHALALIGSTTMHAGFLVVRRARGLWWVALPLGGTPLTNSVG